MSKQQRVLVCGTGFAGQGHADALRYAGGEIVGMVGRTRSVVDEVAARLGIPYAGTHWAQALAHCRPDVVAIGTPGGAHAEPITQAIAHGCHVFCDKPLAEDGAAAQALYDLARQRGVKTAYAASFRYLPHVRHAKELVAGGAIGEPLEVESVSHIHLDRGIPFGWSHRAEEGGGRLNNNFTHKLSIVTSILGEQILSVMGEVRDDLGRAPIVEGVHNFKTRRSFIPDDLADPSLSWGVSNVEWSYTVLARLQSEHARQPVSVMFKHGGLHPRFHDDHLVFYGSKGALYLKGEYGAGPLYLHDASGGWQEAPLPEHIAADTPEAEDDTQLGWRYLARVFLQDVRGEAAAPYQTFEQGSQYQRLIDLIRENNSWTDVRHLR